MCISVDSIGRAELEGGVLQISLLEPMGMADRFTFVKAVI